MSKSVNIKAFALLVILVTLLYGGFSTYDKHFQADSETLVTGRLRCELEGSPSGKYPLGRYQNIFGEMMNYDHRPPLSNNDWQNGYFKKQPAFLIANNPYNQKIMETAASVKDMHDMEYMILNFVSAGDYIRVNLATNDTLNEESNGKVENLKFLDGTGRVLLTKGCGDYQSQFGLQGFAFLQLAHSNWPLSKCVSRAHRVCTLLLAITLAMLCYLLYIKYNLLLAGCFFITFLTSPWIINFSPNIYWVEFTWFIPMLIGLWATTTDASWRYRLMAYIAGLLAITIKCLCGYEYISTIILGMMLFPITEAYALWRKSEKRLAYRLIKLSAGLCFIGVAGFMTALVMHGYLRGDGDILAGIQSIYQHDVLRRTWNSDANAFGDAFAASLSASGISVLKRYFTFHTTVVLGIPGNIFFLLAAAPLLLKLYYWKSHQSEPWGAEFWALYTFSFLETISWLILAKSHSFVHTHMNYVLWYFGFVQCCLYGLALALKERLHFQVQTNIEELTK